MIKSEIVCCFRESKLMLPFLVLNFCVVLKNCNWKIYQTYLNYFHEFFLIVFKTGSP